jgi:hypothetical protein
LASSKTERDERHERIAPGKPEPRRIGTYLEGEKLKRGSSAVRVTPSCATDLREEQGLVAEGGRRGNLRK